MTPDVNNPESIDNQTSQLLQNNSIRKKGLFSFLRNRFPVSKQHSPEARPKNPGALIRMDEEGPNFIATSLSTPCSPTVGRVARSVLLRSSHP